MAHSMAKKDIVKSIDEIDDKTKDKIVEDELKKLESVDKSAKNLVKSVDEIDDKVKDKIVEQHLKKLEKIGTNAKQSALKFQKEARKTTASAMAAAFSFVIALFWRDAVQDLIQKILERAGLTEETYIAKVLAAFLVTIIGVIAIMRISKWGQLDNK